jgi:hypothetical protein
LRGDGAGDFQFDVLRTRFERGGLLAQFDLLRGFALDAFSLQLRLQGLGGDGGFVAQTLFDFGHGGPWQKPEYADSEGVSGDGKLAASMRIASGGSSRPTRS